MSETTTPQVSAPTSYHNRPREAVLLVLNPDGWVEAYAERHVDVHIAIRLHVPPEGEQLADEYLDLTLPRRFRQVYWPGLLRAADTVRTVTPSDVAWREWELELLHAIQGFDLQPTTTEGRRIWIS